MFMKQTTYLDPGCISSRTDHGDEKTFPETLQTHQNMGDLNVKNIPTNACVCPLSKQRCVYIPTSLGWKLL